jgi:hypothetical protein
VGPEGGTIRLDGGVVILVPPGAVDTETTIELEVLDPDDLDASIPSDVEAEGSAISLSAEDVEFSTPVHVTIPRPPGTNVVLWLADGSDEWLIVENVALGDSTFTFATNNLGVFLVGTQAPPSSTANIVPFICTAFGVVESGAADSYSVDYLCQEDGKSYHSLASRFPDLYDLEDLADTVGRGLIDLNIDEGAEPYGIAYAWVDDVFIGRFPREDPFFTCQGCGMPCTDRTTLLLDPGVHELRVETYDSESCTRHFNQGNLVCGNDFDADASLTGLYEGTFTVALGACPSLSVRPDPDTGGPSYVRPVTAPLDGQLLEGVHIGAGVGGSGRPPGNIRIYAIDRALDATASGSTSLEISIANPRESRTQDFCETPYFDQSNIEEADFAAIFVTYSPGPDADHSWDMQTQFASGGSTASYSGFCTCSEEDYANENCSLAGGLVGTVTYTWDGSTLEGSFEGEMGTSASDHRTTLLPVSGSFRYEGVNDFTEE